MLLSAPSLGSTHRSPRRRMGDWHWHRRPELHLAEIDVIRDLVSIERDARGLGADVPLERDRQPEVSSRPTRNHDETPRAVRVPEDDLWRSNYRGGRGDGPCRWRRPESPTRCGATSMADVATGESAIHCQIRCQCNGSGLSKRRARTPVGAASVNRESSVSGRDRDRRRVADEVGPTQGRDQPVERGTSPWRTFPRPPW